MVLISFISGLINGILGFLGSFLPDSPIQDWIAGTESLQTALGWLNWVVPVQELIVIFLAWIALLVAWCGVRLALGKTVGIGKSLVGGSK